MMMMRSKCFRSISISSTAPSRLQASRYHREGEQGTSKSSWIVTISPPLHKTQPLDDDRDSRSSTTDWEHQDQNPHHQNYFQNYYHHGNIFSRSSTTCYIMRIVFKIIIILMEIFFSKVKYNSLVNTGHDWTSKQSQKSKAAATSLIGDKSRRQLFSFESY